jgi:predicted AlkP superfamily phosphohydrolase/phosphomutase
MNARPDRRPVLMIGIDAAEVSLIQKWMDEGALPNLQSLRSRGAWCRLASTAQWLVGSPWPSFYTGTMPSDHGMYHYLIWRPDRMAHERPSPRWMPLEPFWRRIAQAGQHVVAVDIPLAYAPQPYPGIEISGWATHETLEPPASHPPDLMDWVSRRFGRPPFDNEEAHLLPAARLIEVRDQCVNTARLVGELGVALMQEKPWDLFMICFASTHRGGHQLWDRTSMSGPASDEQARALDGALKEVYVACDSAIGALLEEAGSGATVLVYSLHGMGPNASRSDLLREMLSRVLAADGGSGRPSSRWRPLDYLRALVPIEARSWIKNRLPMALQDRLTLFWRTGGIDWSRTRAFAAFCDLDGYVRINLRGREAAGIVEPGEEYERLCSRICEGLATFVDAETGAPLVDGIMRIDQLYPAGRMRAHLPDLMIRWSASPAAAHRRVVSSTYGAIDWPTPGHHPQGRSGNHWPDGFLLAAGPNVSPGATLDRAHILDLAPTVFELMGLPVPAGMHGASLVGRLGRANDVS